MRFTSICLAMVLATAVSSEALSQDLDLDQFGGSPPAEWLPPEGAESYSHPAGASGYGYQYRYGSFFVIPGSPPTVEGIFVMTKQQFPQGPVEKLYRESMTYVGSNSSGALFRCVVDGINRVAVFCQSNRPISVRVDRNQKRLEVVYPFSAYPAFSRIHHEIRRDNGVVYGAWETDASGSVIRFALQHERGDARDKATFPSEPWPV